MLAQHCGTTLFDYDTSIYYSGKIVLQDGKTEQGFFFFVKKAK